VVAYRTRCSGVLGAVAASSDGSTLRRDQHPRVAASLFCLMSIDGDLRKDSIDFCWAIIGTVTAARCAEVWHEERDQLADVADCVASNSN